ncbi:complement C3-like isoform X2 [Plectropomus leopardus]|uniref:complement C3-like isoform X2 n=1 Tax=Plectropomus leopardus TaxID=160734 RepID=UPI001C4B8D9F|nr:complement C3-like isoform X2 [Plectropomus leopardus]
MSGTLLWLVASLAFVSLTSLADGAPMQVMTAPNLLRVGTSEKIFVECQDYTGADIRVEIIVWNHPTKATRLASTSVTLTSTNKFQALGQITIPAGVFSKDPNIKQYVYLQAQFPDRTLEKVVLVSFQSGYIFIQTDKTLYTPNSIVYYRMFGVTPSMEPVERNGTTQSDIIAIDIVTPESIILPIDPVSLKSGIHSGHYQLSEIVSPGLWKVVAKFSSNPQQSYSADFEVKEYVLPSFEVKLTPVSSFFYVDSQELTINIKATYLFGKEVDGTAFVVFGVYQDSDKKSFPSSLQRVQIKEGVGMVKLKREHITKTFPNILQLVGSSIFAAVSVLTESGGEMVEAELRGIQIVTSPYTIHFKKTPKYFKPGMSFDAVVEVVNPDGTPAQGVAVVVDPGQVQGLTAPNGMARLTINTEAGNSKLKISARTNDPHILNERQASATMEALPYITNSNSYIHISVDTAELEVDENLKINLVLSKRENHDITYLILSRGQLVKNGRFKTRGQVLISLTVTVRVDLIEKEHVCSSASKRGKYRQEVNIGPQTQRSVPFIIIPMKHGEYPIEVKAAVKDSSLNDGIMKMLRVVPVGVLVKDPQIVTLDPTKKGVGGKQEEILNSRIPRKDLAPNTPTSTQISVTGREQVSALVENAISGNSMGSLIVKPWGCGEQNIAATTLPVIATTYLDKTNQWETVGFQKRDEALEHIKTGYQRELVYRKTDGSFAVFTSAKSSTWLTAYVAKVFAMASSLVPVQRQHICDAIKFLILNTQQPDGSFIEVGYVYSNALRGDVGGADSDASMTAFCLIAMQESRSLCQDAVISLHSSIDNAVAYLERRLPHLTYSYAVAMTSYALANENKMNREILFKFISPELSHWPVSKGHIYSLEATAYALLALVKVEAFEDAGLVVRWFNQQQKSYGGYGSTQATIIVYQAVAEYWANAKEPEYDLDVDILMPGRSSPTKYKFNRDNQYATRTSKINNINEDVKVTATGTGEATVKMVSLYYALPKEKKSDCQKFNLSVQLLPEKMDEDENTYKLRIDVLYKDKDHDASMSILDIGLLTGFTANTNDLNLLAKGRARTIAKYEMNKVLSERGSLIIYLDKVSHRRMEEISFRIHQKLKVGVLQPAAVSVYEYYDQKHCVKFYHPERNAGQLMRLCRNDECTCAEENCSMQKKEEVTNDQRTTKTCESTPTTKIDFVYKVRLEKFTDSLSTDIYTVRILEVVKEGSYDVGPLDKLRTFLSYPHCRESLDLAEGKTYLIMGTSKDIHRDDQDQTYQYVLGERTWIEYWPTDAECQTDEHRPTCLGMEEMVQQYQFFGCQQK